MRVLDKLHALLVVLDVLVLTVVIVLLFYRYEQMTDSATDTPTTGESFTDFGTTNCH